MPKQPSPFRRLWAANRLLFIFAATILAPGVLLGFFSLRALIHERRLADQQIRERLQVTAEIVDRRVELEFSAWRQAVDQLVQAGATNPASWPARVRTAVDDPGSVVVLLGERKRVRALPPGQVLYSLSSIPESSVPKQQASPLMAEAESLELRAKNYNQAIALYRRLLASAKPSERAVVLHRLARSLKKAGQTEEALRTFRLVAKERPVLIGTLPSDLLALYEVALLERQLGDTPKRPEVALRLYRDLVGGRWQLEKASYAFYSERVREMLPPGEEVARLAQTEHRKLALSLAAERFLDDPRAILFNPEGCWLAFWRSDPFGAVLLGEPFLRTRLWPSVFNTPETHDLQLALLAPTGQVLFGAAPGNHQLLVTHTLSGTQPPLRLQLWPRNPAALYGSIGLRQNLYLGLLGGVVAVLVLGAYLTVRTLRNELAVAQMKSDFVSTVSHEFRSPLAGINQLGEMLRDGRVKDEQTRRRYYEMIVSEGQRLRRLVENVLDFSRMEEGRKQYRFEPFEPTPWLRRIVEDFREEAASAGYSVQATVPESLPVLVGDREALTTAVHNLLDNAVKYSGDLKTVWLEASANGGGFSISICDRGAGIQENDKPHIFERFYRGGGEQKQRVKGAGLGLNLVKHIVTAHGGTVDFESQQGKGSTFTIRLKIGQQVNGAHPAGGR